MPSRKERIASMSKFAATTSYDPGWQRRYRPNTPNTAQFEGYGNELREWGGIARNKMTQIRSSIDTKNKLRARRQARYVNTMRDLTKD